MAGRTGKTYLGNDWQETAEEITGPGAISEYLDYGKHVDSWDDGTHPSNGQKTTSTNSVTGPYPKGYVSQRETNFNS
jgi:hypothetical protein